MLRGEVPFTELRSSAAPWGLRIEIRAMLKLGAGFEHVLKIIEDLET